MGSISNSQAADKDRISELPDALLGHILSFLPTIWAVRTTVLSTRWNNVWTCVSNLDFDCGYFDSCHGCDFDRFHMFVERVLSLTDSSDLKKVSLNTEVTDFARVEGWICTVVRRNVVELVLFLYADNEKEYTFVLPRSVFSCKTLKVLELWGSLRISVPYAPPASQCFPSLKSLYVSDAFPCFTNCPLLEHLTINARFRNIVTDYKIKVSAPELKTLTISDMEHNVYIDAPKLEDLYVLAIVAPNYSLDARSLVDADIEAYFAKDAISILADISNVKYLSLSAIQIEAGHLPIFPNLNRLKVVIRYCNYWESIGLLLDKSPNLENLVLSEEDVEPQWNQIDSELQWDPPKVVPNCLSSHLKTISILSFRARKVEMEVVKYLLKNGHLLDKMTIKYVGYLRTKDFKALYRELNMFQRASMTCQVEPG